MKLINTYNRIIEDNVKKFCFILFSARKTCVSQSQNKSVNAYIYDLNNLRKIRYKTHISNLFSKPKYVALRKTKSMLTPQPGEEHKFFHVVLAVST